MNPLNPIFSVLILIIVLVSTKISGFVLKIKLTEVKHTSIDGLRGYLAVFVFLHHSAIWFYYYKERRWDSPPSHLYNHFGQTSVILFFMITGFLFYNKLIESYKKPIDWFKFYVSRLLRLTPLYYLAVLIMFIIVLIMSGFRIIEPPLILLKKILMWLSYSVIDMPDLNAIENTRYILSWVTWSLVYEWLFYFSLPIVALLIFRIKTGWKTILISIAALIFIFYNLGFDLMNLLPFLGGIAAAVVNKIERVRAIATSVISTTIALSCLVAAVVFYFSPYGIIPISLLSLFFIIVANGNSLFGILHANVSRALGQISYTVYLLHGIFLFTVFTFIVKKPCTTLEYWGIICCIAPVLIFTARIVYSLYEGPIFQSSSRVTEFIRKKLSFTK